MRNFIKNSRTPFFCAATFLAGLTGCFLTLFLSLQVPNTRLKIHGKDQTIRVYSVGSADFNHALLTEKDLIEYNASSWTKEKMDAIESQILANFHLKNRENDYILSVLDDLEEKTPSDLNPVRDFLSIFSEQNLVESESLSFLIPLSAPSAFMKHENLMGAFAKNPLNRIRFCSKEEMFLDFPPEIRLLKSVSPICLGSSFFFLFCSLGICSPHFHLFSSFNDPVLCWIFFLNDLKKKLFSNFNQKSVPVFSVCSYWERLFSLPDAALEATKNTVLLQ